jgi:hypothetical protein
MSNKKLAEALRLGREGAPPTEAERLLFEEWMRGHCWALCATWNGTQYVHEAEAGGDLYPPAMNTRQLFAAWRDRAALASYEAQAEAKPAHRTAREIVDQTEELAGSLMRWAHRREPSSAYGTYRDAEDPRGKSCWEMACKAQEILTATDPENAVSELDEAEPVAPAPEPLTDADLLDLTPERDFGLTPEIEAYIVASMRAAIAASKGDPKP